VPPLRLPTRLEAASRQGGFTLTELLAALAILVLVVGAIATMLESGTRAQVTLTRQLEAQRQARQALVRMREELHCASAMSATPSVAVASITATIPAACLASAGPDVSVQYTAVTTGPGQWSVNRVSGGTTIHLADYLTTGTPFTYTPASAAQLGTVSVLLPVDVDTDDASSAWRLSDSIALRNTARQ
jgi:prepilin-type N-terminal cleavage/methylation domain-containing protein